jgi:carboxypeptidase Q
MNTLQERLRGILLAALLLLLLAPSAGAQNAVDDEVVAAIRREALEQGQVMEHLGWLTDVYGPRLTGSPLLRQASRWAVSQLEAWGVSEARLEPWGPFGRGWSLEHFSARATGDVTFPLHAYPKAWSGSTDGRVAGEVVIFDAETPEDFIRYEGRLTGKVVLVEGPRALAEPFDPPARRRTDEELLRQANAVSAAAGGRYYSEEVLRAYRLRRERLAFLYQQQPLAVLERSSRGDYGTLFVDGAAVPGATAYGPGAPTAWNQLGLNVIPQLVVAAEQYNRLYRLVSRGLSVNVELEIEATYHTDDLMEYNVIAEIPGTDPVIGDELVMIGAHLDSWHAGTGATDNAAGSAVMMEAMRILQAVFDETGRRPRRTIRIALWTGEEQGLHGSSAYVREHFAEPGTGDLPDRLLPGHDMLSAYYNLDNGTGKIRGVYMQGNEALRPVFAAWLAPFHDLGAATLTIANTGSTDHVPFDDVGLPGFQFIQDHIAYGTRTHHSNMDVYDHAPEDDLKQAAAIIASFAYHTAQRDEKLPRKPLPLSLEHIGSR